MILQVLLAVTLVAVYVGFNIYVFYFAKKEEEQYE